MMYQPAQPQMQSTPTNHLQSILQPGQHTPLHSLAQQTAPQSHPSQMLSQMHQSQHDLTSITDIDKEKEKQARENHCEIERRRRVKMAAYFNELCVMVPTCNTLQRKPDKLTILRMASSHMRNLRQANSTSSPVNQSLNDNSYKPSFLTDQELKHLILEAADGFLFVSQCDTGNIIYVSDAVQPVLSYLPTEWTNRSLFEFVHPDDLEKVKDQLSTQETSSVNSTGRILDLKTGTVKKEGHPNSVRSHIGSRRSFICRVRIGHSKQVYMDQQSSMSYPTSSGIWSTSSRANRNRNTLQTDLNDQKSGAYSVVHITGYTKIWPPSQANSQSTNNQNILDQHNMYSNNHYYNSLEDPNGLQATTNFHLIAIARIQMTSTPNDLINSSNCEFVTRHDQNGTVTFVDQRITSLLGYQPNDMLKKQLSDFCILPDQQMLKEQIKLLYETKQSQPIQFTLHMIHAEGTGTEQQTVVKFKTSAYAFCNPCNEQFEFIVCTHVNQSRLNEMSNTQAFGSAGSTAQTSTSAHHHMSQANTLDQYQQYHSMNQYAGAHPSQQAHMSAQSSYQTLNQQMYSTGANYLMMPSKYIEF